MSRHSEYPKYGGLEKNFKKGQLATLKAENDRLAQRLEQAEKKNTLWLFEINEFRDFSRSKQEFSDKMEEWLGERLKEYDAVYLSEGEKNGTARD